MSNPTYKFDVDTKCTTYDFDTKGNGLGNGPDIVMKAGTPFTPASLLYDEDAEVWDMMFESNIPTRGNMLLTSTTKPTLVADPK